jgi:hypothetical protein
MIVIPARSWRESIRDQSNDRHSRVFSAGIHKELKQPSSLYRIDLLDAGYEHAGMTIIKIPGCPHKPARV